MASKAKLTVAIADTIDIADNSHEKIENVDQYLEKLAFILTSLPEDECELSKQKIIKRIGVIKGIRNVARNISSPILETIKSGNINAVKDVLETNPDLKFKEEDGTTALHIASQLGDADMVRLLMERGADVKAKNMEMNTPLHVSCQFGNVEIISMFLKMGVFIDIRNQVDDTPLHIAASYGNADVVKVLLDEGSDFSIKNCENKTAYELCHTEDTIKAFIETKRNTLSKDQKEKLLLKAAVMNWVNVIDSLIGNKVNLNFVDKDKKTALTMAAMNGHSYVVERLLKGGANVNKTGHSNATALFNACKIGDLQSVNFLIQHKAKMQVRNMLCAINNDRHQVLEYLLQNGYDINFKDFFEENSLLHRCAISNSFKSAEILIERGVVTDVCDIDARTPLHLACLNGSVDVVDILLKKGSNVNLMCYYKNNTPLHYACNFSEIPRAAQKFAIVRLLLSYSANKTVKNKENKTALDIAKENIFDNIVDLLE